MSELEYDGYRIPTRLIDKTGGGADTWAGIAENHMRMYATYAPIEPGHDVLEVGCGVGRDAIPLSRLLSTGTYTGVDIMADCIAWCRDNIGARNPNFSFVESDIHSPDYNPAGTLKTTEFELPAADSSVDRIILQSVFTHLLEDEITHYLRQFRRVLRPGGLVCATCFLIDPETLAIAYEHDARYKFAHAHADGVRVQDPSNPRRTVGIEARALDRMLVNAGMALVGEVRRGYWSGRPSIGHFQDYLVLEPA